MLLQDITVIKRRSLDWEDIIRQECSDFLYETNRPLFKELNATDVFKRVKNRHQQKLPDAYAQVLSEAISRPGEHFNLERSVITTSQLSSHYVFPINGYKYVYFPYSNNLKEHFDFVTNATSVELATELASMTHRRMDLHEALNSNIQCAVYNISHYYAVSTALIEYDELYERLIA